MLANVIFFLPFFICLLWSSLFLFRVRSVVQTQMMIALIFGTYYFASYAIFISPWSDYRTMAMLNIFDIPCSYLLIATDFVCVHSHISMRFYRHPLHYLIYLPAIVMATASVLIYYLVGIDGAAGFIEQYAAQEGFPPQFNSPVYRLYEWITIQMRYTVTLVALLGLLADVFYVLYARNCTLRDVYRFLFKGDTSDLARVTCCLQVLLLTLFILMAGLHRTFFMNNVTISVVLSVLLAVVIFMLAYVEYMGEISPMTFSRLANMDIVEPLLHPHVPGVTGKNDYDGQSKTRAMRTEEQLVSKLAAAFDEEEVYRDASLSIQSLAAALGTNRTTLSALINQVYGVPFRQLLSNYRIEAAKDYMLHHPDALQDEVAEHCGFLTPQSFNMKFKEVTGLSPRVWLVKQ